MAEWLVEEGVGEVRAALVDSGEIVEAALEWDDDGVRAGAVLPARLVAIHVPGRRGLVRFDGGEALIEPLPRGITEGAALTVEIVREAIAEPGRPKLAKARAAAADAETAPGPSLIERVAATGLPVRRPPTHGPDALEAAGWSELLEEATTGDIAFPGGALRLSPTPAMTLFDVDGGLPPAELARTAAAAVVRAIRRIGIGGSIGVDFPSLSDRIARQEVAEIVDALLPQPFERTAVNGFGFLQIVRRRTRPSLPERMAERIPAQARILLRRAERARGHGARRLVAHPRLIALIESRLDWQAELARRTGAAIVLRADPGLAISAAHVETEHP